MIIVNKNSDACIYRKFKTLTMSEYQLNTASEEFFTVKLTHRNCLIRAKIEDIRKLNWTTQQHNSTFANDNGVMFHYPLQKWELIEGDNEWLTKIYADHGWKIKE